MPISQLLDDINWFGNGGIHIGRHGDRDSVYPKYALGHLLLLPTGHQLPKKFLLLHGYLTEYSSLQKCLWSMNWKRQFVRIKWAWFGQSILLIELFFWWDVLCSGVIKETICLSLFSFPSPFLYFFQSFCLFVCLSANLLVCLSALETIKIYTNRNKLWQF